VSFAGRLVLGTFAIVVLTLLVLIWGSERTLRRTLETELESTLGREARLVGLLFPRDSTRWESAIRQGSVEEGHRIQVRAMDGRVLASTDSLLGPRVMRVEDTIGATVVMVGASLESIDGTVSRARRSMMFAAGTALLVALVLALLAGKSIARPLVDLAGSARSIASGSQPRFPNSNITEVAALASALRQMNRELANRLDAVQRHRAASAALVDAMSDGLVAADGRGQVVLVNSAARQLLGYGPDETLPGLRTLFRSKEARAAVDAVLAGQVVESREVVINDRTLAINARPAGDAGTVLILRDLTEIRRLEAVRRDFVANVSHELKTPLTSISGYAETLAGGDVDPETAARFLATIRDNASRMQALVDDLLDLSRVESGTWTPRPASVELKGAIQRAWSPFVERAAQKQVEFTMEVADDAANAMVDHDALEHVLANLFDNALRHTAAGGTINVQARRRDAGVEVSVTDNGSGIQAEHLPRIFERFYRVDPSRSRHEGGTGLGLSIVRHLVEAHGGEVSAESVYRRGTTIRCWFPGVPTA
jgi:two-component system phosphate regulon sensor histidine kinase PhoR